MIKDRTLFGTKVFNHNTRELGLVLYTLNNKFSKNGGGYEYIPYATCVDKNGRNYNIKLDSIEPTEDMDDEELKELGL